MGIFEIFRKQTIKIQPDKNLTMNYYAVDKVTEVFPKTGDELLYIKKKLDQNDVEFLESFSCNGTITVKSENPNDIFCSDIQNIINEKYNFGILDNISLNYLHTNDTLFVFSDEIEKPSVPNVVKVYPVKRNDLEEYYSVPINTEIKSITPDENKSGEDEPADDSKKKKDIKNDPDDIVAEIGNTNDGKKQELQLLLTALKDIFDHDYIRVKVDFKGAAIERKTISLTDFYEKNGISPGRLRGSWTIFEKAKVKNIFESGIVTRAMNAVYDKFTVNIDGYGRIIKTEDKDKFQKIVKEIENDYKTYLRGGSIKKIGDQIVNKQFKPKETVETSINELKKYLLSIRPNNEDEEVYYWKVDWFIDGQVDKCMNFENDVYARSILSTFHNEQWKSKEFLSRIKECIDKNKKEKFFGDSFIELMERTEKYLQKPKDSK